MKRIRRSFSPEKKIAIIRQHLIEKVPVADVCKEHKIWQSIYYRWQSQLFENGSLATQKDNRKVETTKPRPSWREQEDRDEIEHGEWILHLTYGQPSYSDLADLDPEIDKQDIDICLHFLKCGPLHVRKRVASILSSRKGIPCRVASNTKCNTLGEIVG